MRTKHTTGTIAVPQGNENYKVVKYFVRTFEEQDEDFGLEGGKIYEMKAYTDEKTLFHFHGEWEIEPNEKDKDTMIALSILVNDYNY